MPQAAEDAASRALGFVVQQAADLGGVVANQTSREAELDIPVTLVDGSTLTYRLRVSASGDRLTVGEASPAHLPGCCPNRHINWDGTFCITWSSHSPIRVTDAESAALWWRTVYRFLQEQHRAGRKRRWPGKDDWAHGDAAREQLRSEEAARRLGGDYPARLSGGRLRVTKRRHFYRLSTTQGQPLYSVWIEHRRVAMVRQHCLCPRGRTKRSILRSCGDHASAAVELVLGMVGREKAERAFWHQLRGQPCCGTMDDCPLAAAQQS